MEVSDVRRYIRTAIDDARRQTDERRTRNDAAVRAWERVLAEVAVPLFHQFASALTAEGYRFKVETPGAAVRLVPERGGDEFVELVLDTEGDDPLAMIRSTRGRGRRSVTNERPLNARIDVLTDGEIATGLVQELTSLLQR